MLLSVNCMDGIGMGWAIKRVGWDGWMEWDRMDGMGKVWLHILYYIALPGW